MSPLSLMVPAVPIAPPPPRRSRSSRPPRPRFRLLAVAGLLAAVLAAGPPAAAQEIHLVGLASERLGDAELAQGTVIVVVWATWSPRSRDIVERVKPLAARWGPRAKVVTVDFEEERPAIEAFLAGRSLGAPVFLDSDGIFSKKYAIATLPGLLVLKEGKTVYHGKLPDDPDRLIADLLR
jgi:thiol-disulfide isomerase/thioredoxin